MAHAITHRPLNKELPDWVSSDVRLYLEHIEGGVTIRALARVNGVHASTILRKVRKTESRRDDPLIDKVLIHLGKLRRVQGEPQVNPKEAVPEMTDAPPDEVTLKRDATRILRALMQTGAVLAVVPDVETAVVVVEAADGRPRQVATVESRIAQAMALQNWITFRPQGRVARYYITPKGRIALNRFLAETESHKAGFAEAKGVFKGAKAPGLHAVGKGQVARRAIGAEPPIQVLARRRDKTGQHYLSPELVTVSERLRVDFELALMAGPAGANWDAIMKGTKSQGKSQSKSTGQGPDLRPVEARTRIEKALRFLGPELGDMALITCCHQQGMEHAEKELHMPARSGKFVLRIALNMLARHYAKEGNAAQDMIY